MRSNKKSGRRWGSICHQREQHASAADSSRKISTIICTMMVIIDIIDVAYNNLIIQLYWEMCYLLNRLKLVWEVAMTLSTITAWPRDTRKIHQSTCSTLALPFSFLWPIVIYNHPCFCIVQHPLLLCPRSVCHTNNNQALDSLVYHNGLWPVSSSFHWLDCLNINNLNSYILIQDMYMFSPISFQISGRLAKCIIVDRDASTRYCKGISHITVLANLTFLHVHLLAYSIVGWKILDF